MNHIDLFSGIGGFAYAARQVWPDYHNLFFCDTNIFCQAVIRKNFGADSLIYGDIREVNIERVIADTAGPGRLRAQEHKNDGENSNGGWGYDITNPPCHVDLLTGGFPCQPFSAAGKRKGRDDDRHLWPEMFRVIGAFRPRWVIAENVRGLVNIENGMALQQVFLDLESIGYAVQAFIIPACAVNAPHRRDRVWIVANNIGGRCNQNGECGSVEAIFRKGSDNAMPLAQSDRHAADAGQPGLQKRYRCDTGRTGQDGGAVADGSTGSTWKQSWLEVATRLCRVDDGLPARVDGNAKGIRGGYLVEPGGPEGRRLISKSKHREERLKALGNAIVPQVVIEIMKKIKEIGV